MGQIRMNLCFYRKMVGILMLFMTSLDVFADESAMDFGVENTATQNAEFVKNFADKLTGDVVRTQSANADVDVMSDSMLRLKIYTKKPLKPDRGYVDDIARTVHEIESLNQLPLIEIPPLKNMTNKINNETVCDAELVQYISEVQAVIVALRQSYLDILRGHAEWTARWYEVHFPDYYACVSRNLLRLMRESMIAYPKKVIIKIRAVKDAILRSYITREPIAKVDPEVFDGLNELLGNMRHVLNDHRQGQGADSGVGNLLEAQVRNHEEQIRIRCKIPLTDGHSLQQELSLLGKDYDADEDYEPGDYFRINN